MESTVWIRLRWCLGVWNEPQNFPFHPLTFRLFDLQKAIDFLQNYRHPEALFHTSLTVLQDRYRYLRRRISRDIYSGGLQMKRLNLEDFRIGRFTNRKTYKSGTLKLELSSKIFLWLLKSHNETLSPFDTFAPARKIWVLLTDFVQEPSSSKIQSFKETSLRRVSPNELFDLVHLLWPDPKEICQ